MGLLINCFEKNNITSETTSQWIRRRASRRGSLPRVSHVKDRYGEPERESEWEPIKILLEGDGDSNKTNTASNTRLRLTTQVGQVHTATGMLLNLGTNSQPHRPESAAEHQNSSPLTNTGQTGEQHRSDRSLLVKPGNFHRMAPHRSGRCNTPVRPVSARKPQNTKQAY
jgi:hypothetical protein